MKPRRPLDRLEVMNSLKSASTFVTGQVGEARPAWGVRPGGVPDPWTTGQLASVLNPRIARERSALLRAIAWLEQAQKLEGSWASVAYGSLGDTPSTACCTIALLRHLGIRGVAAQKGLDWLCRTFTNGWTTQPTAEAQRFQSLHHYSTAYALRALSRGPKLPMHSMCIQEAVAVLMRARIKKAGWGYQHDSPPDPTFTSYVLHGIFDVRDIWGLPLDTPAIAQAVTWLAGQQRSDGCWSDWHGIEKSPEATAYAVYVLLRSDAAWDDAVALGVDSLLATQHVDGSWSMDADGGDEPNNWVTFSCLLALKEVHKVIGPRDDTFHRNLTPEKLIRFGDAGARTSVPMDGNANELPDYYSDRIATPLDAIPHTRPIDHTMFRALDEYVAQKLPMELLEEALFRKQRIEVHGIYPPHFTPVASALGYKHIRSVRFAPRKGRRFNNIRPEFYRAVAPDAEEVVAVAVVPGADYVLHYASMVRHLALEMTTHAQEHLITWRYPHAEMELGAWTGLDESLVRPDDRVVLGLVEAAEEGVRSGAKALDAVETDYYVSHRYELPDKRTLCFLGVRFSFWGSISHILCHKLCELQAGEIIYASKVGALTRPEDLYSKIFCPDRYWILNHDEVIHEVPAPSNPLLAKAPGCATGGHVSVPTVLEEDYDQRRVATSLGAQTIDNEVSQMAWAIYLQNESSHREISFVSAHFATDYVRGPNERRLKTRFDLSNNRIEPAVSAKREIIGKLVADVVAPYLLDQ